MFFTQEDYLKIEDWLRRRAVKDTWFDPADTLKGDEQVAIIQDSRNKRMPIQQLIKELGEINIEGDGYFLNLNACLNTPDTQYTLSEAIEAIPERYRIKGLTLNYLGNGYMESPEWYMLRFEGDLEDFEDTSKWKPVIPSHTSQTDAFIEGLGIRLEQGVIPTETSINTDALLLDEYPKDMYIIAGTNNPYLIPENDLNNSPDYRNFFKVAKIKGYKNYDEENPNSLEEDGQREKWICIPPATASGYGLYNPTHYSIVESLTNGFVIKISSKYSRYFNISAKAGTNNREFELDNTWIENLTRNYILKEYTQNGVSEDSLDAVSKIQGIGIQDPSTNTRYVVASMKALETMPLYKRYDGLDNRSIIKAINDIEGDVEDIQDSVQSINNTINDIEGDVNDIQSSIQTISNTVDSLSDNVDSLNNTVDSLNNTVELLQRPIEREMVENPITTDVALYDECKIYAHIRFFTQSCKTIRTISTIPDLMFSVLMLDHTGAFIEMILGIKSFSFMPCMIERAKCITDGILPKYSYRSSSPLNLANDFFKSVLYIVPEYTYDPSTESGTFSLSLVIEAYRLRSVFSNTLIPTKIWHSYPDSSSGTIFLHGTTGTEIPRDFFPDRGNVIKCVN